MSDFIISGFSESALSQMSLPSVLDVRRAELAQQAYVELSKFEFGAMDLKEHRRTVAALSVLSASHRAGALSHSRAKQRTHSYAPTGGREHCPHCWVYEGAKRPLQFVEGERVETASCTECNTQFQLLKM